MKKILIAEIIIAAIYAAVFQSYDNPLEYIGSVIGSLIFPLAIGYIIAVCATRKSPRIHKIAFVIFCIIIALISGQLIYENNIRQAQELNVSSKIINAQENKKAVRPIAAPAVNKEQEHLPNKQARTHEKPTQIHKDYYERMEEDRRLEQKEDQVGFIAFCILGLLAVLGVVIPLVYFSIPLICFIKNKIMEVKNKLTLIHKQHTGQHTLDDVFAAEKQPCVNKELETSLRAAFPDLSAYFDTVFPFMRTADVEGYSFLFAQVSAQIKHGADVNATPKQLFPLWKYLLDIQVQRHYLTSAQAQEVLAEMSKWVKNNG
ncbi:hypothetical protein [Candidatus Avelusimicrobium facis]|uniref:hypothetical protein n=1 Tax=Candidatus Avelusimicrobium facis TaxID=3416203 RepID=UPI003D150E25